MNNIVANFDELVEQTRKHREALRAIMRGDPYDQDSRSLIMARMLWEAKPERDSKVWRIKVLRTAHNLGLKEAKRIDDIVEWVMGERTI